MLYCVVVFWWRAFPCAIAVGAIRLRNCRAVIAAAQPASAAEASIAEHALTSAFTSASAYVSAWASVSTTASALAWS